MIKWPQFFLLIAIALPGGTACRLRPPQTTPVRMIEPVLVEPPMQGTSAPGTKPVRLLDTQARAHLGRRVLHRGSAGAELASRQLGDGLNAHGVDVPDRVWVTDEQWTNLGTG